MLKKLGKILLYLIIAFLIVLFSLFAIIYTNQNKIIQLTISELNKYLVTKVEIDEKIEIDLISQFPQASIKLQNVRIQESVKESNKRLAELHSAYLALDLWTLVLKREISISKIFLEHGSLNIKFLKDGSNNFSIIKLPEESSENSGADFNINHVALKNVNLFYDNEISEQQYNIMCHNNQANISYVNEVWDIGIEGKSHINNIIVSKREYLKDKALELSCHLKYDEPLNKLTIHPSEIKMNKFIFSLNGKLNSKGTPEIDMAIEGKEGRIESLISLLPPHYRKDAEKFKATGNVYFKGKISGPISSNANPMVQFDFGFSNTSLEHPDLKSSVSNATLRGSFTNGKLRNATSTVLIIDELEGVYNKKSFKGKIKVANLNEPHLDMQLSGTFDLKMLMAIHPIEDLSSADGEIDMDVHFYGQLNDFKTREGNKRIKTSGDIVLRNVEIKHKKYPYKFRDLNGHFIFNRSDLAINDFTGYAGKSNFELTGSFRNIIPRLIFQSEKLYVDASLKSDFIDLEELLNYKETTPKEEVDEPFRFTLFDHYDLKLNCNVKRLKFRKFSAKNINTNLETNAPYVHVKNSNLLLAGGALNFNTSLNLNNPEEIGVHVKGTAENIHSDSLFYIFSNFDQDFITDQNLQGQISCKLDMAFLMDHMLEIQASTISAHIDASIKNGHLVNFEPMQRLSKFIDEKDLENIYFSEMSNELNINNGYIYIPEMEIKSNIANINISGSHSFNSDMDYRLGIPLKTLKKNHKDRDEAFGAIADDGRRGAVLFLTIKGNSSDYKIGYDSKRAVRKIENDLKDEGQEIKDIIKGRKETDTQYHELDTEEYFEFDDD